MLCAPQGIKLEFSAGLGEEHNEIIVGHPTSLNGVNSIFGLVALAPLQNVTTQLDA
jgi:hypothetical protein